MAERWRIKLAKVFRLAGPFDEPPTSHRFRHTFVRILLENTAGQGECIGHRFEHLRAIMDRCPKLKLGVCIDTAHSFTAGRDIGF